MFPQNRIHSQPPNDTTEPRYVIYFSEVNTEVADEFSDTTVYFEEVWKQFCKDDNACFYCLSEDQSLHPLFVCDGLGCDKQFHAPCVSDRYKAPVASSEAWECPECQKEQEQGQGQEQEEEHEEKRSSKRRKKVATVNPAQDSDSSSSDSSSSEYSSNSSSDSSSSDSEDPDPDLQLSTAEEEQEQEPEEPSTSPKANSRKRGRDHDPEQEQDLEQEHGGSKRKIQYFFLFNTIRTSDPATTNECHQHQTICHHHSKTQLYIINIYNIYIYYTDLERDIDLERERETYIYDRDTKYGGFNCNPDGIRIRSSDIDDCGVMTGVIT
jgi:hypothetical protein